MRGNRRQAAAVVVGLVMVLAAGAPVRAGDKEHDKERDEDRPTEKMGLKSRVFEIKNRATEDLMKVIRPLTSGIKGTSIVESSEFRTITVRDFPENVAAIDEALRRLDVPRPARSDIELRIRVLIAGSNGASQYPGELEPVVKQLHATLAYKSYYQIASITHRVKSGSGAKGKGVTTVTPPVASEAGSMNYSYSFEDVGLAPPGAGPTVVQIRRLSYWIGGKPLGDAEINTGLSLREGEKVVVGTASLKDRAMILVLFAHIVK